MTARILDAATVTARVYDGVAHQVAAMSRPPGLATVVAGPDTAAVRAVRAAATAAGLLDLHHRLSPDVNAAELADVLDTLAAAPEVTGILLSVPPRLQGLAERIPEGKDVDGVTAASVASLDADRPGLRPAMPAAVLALLDAAGVPLSGVDTVVTHGPQARTVAQLLLRRNASVTVCRSGTAADLVIATAGWLAAGAVRPGATVIDVGAAVNLAAVRPVAGVVTMPGAVAAVSTAMLVHNTVTAAQRFAPVPL